MTVLMHENVCILRTICGKMSLKMMIISNKKYLNSLLTLMHLLFQMIKNINFLADHQIVLTVGSQSPFSWNVLYLLWLAAFSSCYLPFTVSILFLPESFNHSNFMTAFTRKWTPLSTMSLWGGNMLSLEFKSITR